MYRQLIPGREVPGGIEWLRIQIQLGLAVERPTTYTRDLRKVLYLRQH